MRGTREDTATLASNNTVEFEYPYAGGSQLHLWLSRLPGKPDAAFVVIQNGQFGCDGCDIQVKFDSGGIEAFRTDKGKTNSSDGQSLVVAKSADWIGRLKNSKTVVVEVEFARAGKKQFTFTTAGLKWPPTK